MQTKTLTIINKLGLHARAAMKLVDTASRFQSQTCLIIGGHSVDAKDILQTMSIGATQGTNIIVQVDGSDEDKALHAIETLINDYFGEGE